MILSACVRPSTRRIHAQNMAKAEAFKPEFDKHVPSGTPRAHVEAYVRSRGLGPGNILGEDGTGDVLYELYHEESISWYCGKGSVGLQVHFTANRVDRTSTAAWSFDCP
jgi:hypothetical protein